ncbi:MAG: glutamate racemase [Candidatus Margulisiibacteriota bacterium]|nr:glutamate racemase [Candidatus Margulisiibacteriota bacterium]
MSEISNVPKIGAEKIQSGTGIKARPVHITPDQPIGLFDSGVGGLTVVKEIMRKLPSEDLVYVADTARVPYGGRSSKEIIKINVEIINFLMSKKVKMVVMACGTSSSIAYPVLKDEYPVPIISMIEPGSKAALNASRNKVIGIIATVGTVHSMAYQEAIRRMDPSARPLAAACPLFVPLIEGGFTEAEETKKVAREYLKPLLAEGIDTLIMGCTHYPHISKLLKGILGPHVALIDPAREAANLVLTTLKEENLLAENKKAQYEYFVSGSAPQFVELGSRLLGRPIAGAEQVKFG